MSSASPSRIRIYKHIKRTWKSFLCFFITVLFILFLPSWNNAIARDYEETKNVQSALLSPARSNTSRRAVQVHPQPGTVALTFDDGPHPRYTPEVLAILKRYQVKATFFVVGECVRQHPELLRAIQADGHVIASHTMTHPQLTRLSGQKLDDEVIGTSELIQSVTGKLPLCLRPPYGLINPRLQAYIEANHLQVVLWDASFADYLRQSPAHLAERVLKQTHSGDIILLHDGVATSSQTVAALPQIIEGLRQKGFQFVTICGDSNDPSPTEQQKLLVHPFWKTPRPS